MGGCKVVVEAELWVRPPLPGQNSGPSWSCVPVYGQTGHKTAAACSGQLTA